MHRQLLGCVFTCLFTLGALLPPSLAQGTLRWNWTFDQTRITVGPADSFTVTATVSVHPDSALPLTTPSISGTYAGPLQALYDFNCTFCGDLKFVDFNLPPGQSYQFPFGTFVPKGSVPAGIYPSDPALLIFTGSGQRGPDSYFEVQVIPEATAPAIFLLGAAALMLRRTRLLEPSNQAHAPAGFPGREPSKELRPNSRWPHRLPKHSTRVP